MSRTLSLTVLLLFLALTSAAPAERSIVIQFTGMYRGRISGCECPGGQAGGYARRTTAIRKQIGNTPIVGFDCGGFLDLDEHSGGKLRSLCTLKAFRKSGILATGVTARDLFYGVEYLHAIKDESGIDLISANIIDAATRENIFDRWQEYEFNGLSLAVTSLTRYQEGRLYGNSIGWTKIRPDSVMEDLTEDLPSDSDITILLTDMSEADLRKFTSSYSIFDIVVTSTRQFSSKDNQALVGNTHIFHPKPDGRSLDWITTDNDGSLDYHQEYLDNRFEEDSEAELWLDRCFKKDLD